jgi:hypothetical protein
MFTPAVVCAVSTRAPFARWRCIGVSHVMCAMSCGRRRYRATSRAPRVATISISSAVLATVWRVAISRRSEQHVHARWRTSSAPSAAMRVKTDALTLAGRERVTATTIKAIHATLHVAIASESSAAFRSACERASTGYWPESNEFRAGVSIGVLRSHRTRLRVRPREVGDRDRVACAMPVRIREPQRRVHSDREGAAVHAGVRPPALRPAVPRVQWRHG